MKIFSYNELKNKAQREIKRLHDAELALDIHFAVDSALNAAFTIYHLIDWRQEDSKQKISAHHFIFGSKNNAETSNQGLKVLHNVVIKNKHTSVSVKTLPLVETDPLLNESIIRISDNNGNLISDNDNNPIVSNDSSIKVYFGKYRAFEILNNAMKEFLS